MTDIDEKTAFAEALLCKCRKLITPGLVRLGRLPKPAARDPVMLLL